MSTETRVELAACNAEGRSRTNEETSVTIHLCGGILRTIRGLPRKTSSPLRPAVPVTRCAV